MCDPDQNDTIKTKDNLKCVLQSMGNGDRVCKGKKSRLFYTYPYHPSLSRSLKRRSQTQDVLSLLLGYNNQAQSNRYFLT